MENQFNEYVQLIQKHKRFIRNENTKFLRDRDSKELATFATCGLQYGIVYGKVITNICGYIGKKVLPSSENPEQLFDIGYTLLHILCKAEKISMKRESALKTTKENERSKLFGKWYSCKTKGQKNKKGDRSPKVLEVLDNEWFDGLLYSVPIIEGSPDVIIMTEEPEDWKGFYHPVFGALIHNAPRHIRRKLTPERCPKLFAALNKVQCQGFEVNDDILDVFEHCKSASDALITFVGKKMPQKSKDGKVYEQRRTISEAKEFRGQTIWLPANIGFRSRFYYKPSYLQYGGTDLAKALLMCAKEYRVELGQKGYDQALIGMVNHWGDDKLSKEEKLEEADERMEEFIDYGKNWKTNKGWQKADKPWQFLSLCIEFAKCSEQDNPYEYEWGVFVGRDASTSGPMLMGLATMDEKTLELTNLIESKTRRDIYLTVGRRARQIILTNMSAAIPEVAFDRNNLKDLLKNEELLKDVAHHDLYEIMNDDVKLRKLIKRSVMIIGYSAEEWCIAETLWEDFYHEYSILTPVHCKVLADAVYEAYSIELPACIQIMEGFKKLSSLLHSIGEDVEFESEYTGFPFAQHYRRPIKVDRRVKYLGKQVEFSLIVGWEKRDYSGGKSGAAPNIVHNWDATLLTMLVNEFDGPLAVNHDAFYTLPTFVDDLDYQLRHCTYKLASDFDLLDSVFKPHRNKEVHDIEYVEVVSKSGNKYMKKKTLDTTFTIDEVACRIDRHQIPENFNPYANGFCYA